MTPFPPIEADTPDASPSASDPSSQAESSSASSSKLGAELELNGLVGSGTTLVGTYSFAGTVRIDGVVDGDVRGGRCLIVGPSATVRGSLTADLVIVLGGEVEAEITGHERVELRVPAVVSGRVHSPEVYMDPGIQFSGICDMKPTRAE